MRILHITATHLNPTGGVVVVLKNLTEAQNAIDGVDSRVLSIRAKVDEIDSPYFSFLGTDNIFTFIEKYNPDMAILHSFFCFDYVATTKALLKMKIPFFIEPHGSFGRQAMNKSYVKKIVANNTIFKSQIKDSVGYIFTNQAEYLDSVYRSSNELIIPNGIIPEVVHDARNKDTESISNPTIYFLGRYDIHHKGLDYLFDALDYLEKEEYEVKINLYGTGNKKQLEFIESHIKKYKVISVENCGTIYGLDKKKALEKCNILILTSRYEGSPMTVLDGLSYGNPCIATPGTNIAEEVANNRIGWRAELDAGSIAKTIIEAVEDYKLNGNDYYYRCREYVLSNYAWDRIGKYSIEQYNKVLNKHYSGGVS